MTACKTCPYTAVCFGTDAKYVARLLLRGNVLHATEAKVRIKELFPADCPYLEEALQAASAIAFMRIMTHTQPMRFPP